MVDKTAVDEITNETTVDKTTGITGSDEMTSNNKPVILCVDDEERTLAALCQQLNQHFGDDYHIKAVTSADEALELATAFSRAGRDIPLVISDDVITEYLNETNVGKTNVGKANSVNKVSGRAFIANVHDTLPDTLTMLLTDPHDPDNSPASEQLHGLDETRLYRYMVKPWQATDLRITVAQALRSYVQGKALRQQQASLKHANQELQAFIRAYDRFVPDEFLSFLGKKSITDVKLGDQVAQEMTMLFSDIRDFTSISEKMTPQENFNFINEYLSRMQPFIAQYHGFIDKYIGDAIMALFPTSANDALDAAIGMLKSLNDYNEDRPKREQLRIGIGLHTGTIMLGTVGGENRMDSTVIGDAVNLSSRVEGLTKIYGVNLLITEHTLAKLQNPEAYALREIDRVTVKGKRKPVTVYEVFETDDYEMKVRKQASLEFFSQGLVLYREQKYTEARAMFYEVLQINPEDKAARLYRTESSKSSVYGRLWNE
jgi:class 3 adenylate cyclase